MDFPNVYSPSLKIFTNPGKLMKPVFKSRFQKNGSIEVVKKSEINLYKEINAYKDSVDINKLISRYQAGEKDILDRRKSQYLDVTGIPEDYFTAVNQINDLKDRFNSLPVSIKKKFDFSADKYVSSICSGDFDNLLFATDNKIVDKKEVEKKEDEKKDVDKKGVDLNG